MCGEHDEHRERRGDEMGSSPHVRGALGITQSDVADTGIIPACAGSTHAQSTRLANPRDHPRMCGEHHRDAFGVDDAEGSSPHVRGALRHIKKPTCRHGIIPACAGSTTVPHTLRHGRGDHPRMCGEHFFLETLPVRGAGSSPHVRGALTIPFLRFVIDGIIPACAGSTPARRSPSTSIRDHPRMCGEHICSGL